jgi:poly(3-hydroxybutyrate) depolymerase
MLCSEKNRRTRAHPVLALALALAMALWALPAFAQTTTISYAGRDILLLLPPSLPPSGQRALVVVLHGGMGNAGRIEAQTSEAALNMDAQAAQHGFIVAYLNGTAATRMGGNALAWNAGGCCGQPAAQNIDDTAYITGAVAVLEAGYGIDPARIYVMGHSNGSMMAQKLLCETTVFAAGVTISGPLNTTESCPAAKGHRILAIHGADDDHVPIAGGRGTEGISHATFQSEAAAAQIFQSAGASYTLQIVPGVGHKLDDIEAAFEQTNGISIPQKATEFFGLAKSP